ncbi:TSC22 domain family protein 1-like [Carassius carassius]|uniref:TSC22 domain family protein 1-like n=1 Tax=Carassius carassius TaxID=217509 RepID=UPI002868F131|nr:TSC22 domain family protein 1-like [Carassius carassius]
MAHPPSPGPHSLGIPTVKKKSGFQITSVLPAQGSSANTSLADDTESYDDMDESHTEDLSSSDILDVSVSRATDTGVPERSSSEETLNSLHGGETPNEPVMVNGVHHHHHHHHKTGRSMAPSATPSTIPVSPQAPAPSGRSVPAEASGSASSSVSVTTDSAAGATVPLTSANPSSTASRFRVVKLDSSSEPVRKGRWTCTEFHEKDAPPGDVASVAHRALESIIQSEHESTSSSSSGSTLSSSGGGGGDVQQVYGQDLVPPTESSSAPVRSEPQSSYTPVEHAPITANLQPLLIPNATSPVSIGIPGPVSPRPPQMDIIPENPGAQLSSSHSSSLALSALQPLRAPLHLSGSAYVTASQLEDAQRLLLQHHTLLSLAAGGRAGPSASASALGQDAAAAVFSVSAAADEDSSSGASLVAIDNKIEQAMDLVKSHLMYAVREEVEVLKEQIKELMERNSQLEQENTLLKNLSSPEQLTQFQTQVQTGSPPAGTPGPGPTA